MYGIMNKFLKAVETKYACGNSEFIVPLKHSASLKPAAVRLEISVSATSFFPLKASLKKREKARDGMARLRPFVTAAS